MFDFSSISSNACTSCDKASTLPIISFELFILIGTVIMLYILSRLHNNILKRYGIVAIGVFIFEFFTAPMWNNDHLGNWAYVYQDVSWILTAGWSTLILTVIIFVDKIFKKLIEIQRFLIYLAFLTLIVIFFESIVINIGIRTYAPETLELINNLFIPIFNVPLQGLYYIPVFTGLVIGFYKYWNLILDKKAIVPVKKNKWFRNLLLSFTAVIFFELMVDPMAVNAKFPEWSYFYRDLSIIMSGFWVIIIWLVTTFVDKFFIHLNLSKRFVMYLITAGVIMTPIEGWFIQNGFRIYSPSAVANFSGYNTIIFNTPIEVIFAISFYLALVISLIRYWQIVLDNKQ